MSPTRENLPADVPKLEVGFQQLTNNSRPRGNIHFEHDQPDESFDRIWADFHSLRDLLAREPLQQRLNRLLFSRRKSKPFTEFDGRNPFALFSLQKNYGCRGADDAGG